MDKNVTPRLDKDDVFVVVGIVPIKVSAVKGRSSSCDESLMPINCRGMVLGDC